MPTGSLKAFFMMQHLTDQQLMGELAQRLRASQEAVRELSELNRELQTAHAKLTELERLKSQLLAGI